MFLGDRCQLILGVRGLWLWLCVSLLGFTCLGLDSYPDIGVRALVQMVIITATVIWTPRVLVS